jgi:proline dehydrogenase
MLRQFLLGLARISWMKKLVMHFPPARRVARRFVAGERLSDALAVTRDLNAKGLKVTLDLLGENVYDVDAAHRAAEQYLDILKALKESGLQSHVSLKLTQMGLDLGNEIALANLRRVLEAAKEIGSFVRLDMEGSEYTERTLQVFYEARKEYDNVGAVIQAYLRRSKSDIAMINRIPGRVRLCKGAYSEPASQAFQGRDEVNRNMKDLLHDLLLDGDYPGIASHDEEIIQDAISFTSQYKIPTEKFEFQMLYGIRRERQNELHSLGYNVRVYVPFGTDWYPYFMRRLAERPANLVFFITALFRG